METQINPINLNRIRPEQIISLNHGYVVEICQNLQSLKCAFHLRSSVNEFESGKSSKSQKLIYDRFDSENHTFTFLVWKGQMPVGSIRSSVFHQQYDWKASPSTNLIHQELKKEIGAKASFIESDQLVIHPDFSWQKSIAAQLALFQMQLINAIVHQVQVIVTLSNKQELSIYQEFLGMRTISSFHRIGPKGQEKVYLLAINIQRGMETVRKHNLPYITEIEIERLKTLIDMK